MRLPLRTQLLLPVLLLLAGIAAMSVYSALAAADEARRAIEERLRTVVRFLARESTFPLSDVVLRQLATLTGAEFVLFTADGALHSSLDLSRGRPHLAGARDTDDFDLESLTVVGGERYLYGGLHFRRRDGTAGTLYLLYPERARREARNRAVRPYLVLGVTLGLIALVLTASQAQYLSGRVRDVERRTRRIADGDFAPMPLPRRDDELRDLSASVNDMAVRLDVLQQAVRRAERLRLLGQVSGGLAHQMRNGLTGAKLAVQLYLRENADADAGPLEVALRQLTLLETHVRRFLDLGREDEMRREPIDLPGMIAEAVRLVEPQCVHAAIALSADIAPAGPPLTGDRGQLSGAVFNLLGNAIDAAGPGGAVSVTLTAGGGGWSLAVADSGPGPPAEIADRLFEPFVTGKPEGVGLGLAMARRVVERHGGSLAWDRAEGRTCFRVRLPRLPPLAPDPDDRGTP